jgi:hypothetical protein
MFDIYMLRFPEDFELRLYFTVVSEISSSNKQQPTNEVNFQNNSSQQTNTSEAVSLKNLSDEFWQEELFQQFVCNVRRLVNTLIHSLTLTLSLSFPLRISSHIFRC